MRIIEHDQTDKLRMVRRQIASERDNILPVLISAFRINFLRRSGLARNRKTWNGSGGSGAAIAHYTAQRITDLSGSFRRNYLTLHYRGKRADGFSFRRVNRFYDAWRDQFAAVGNHRHRHRHL